MSKSLWACKERCSNFLAFRTKVYMKKILFPLICAILMTACGTSHKATEDNDVVRWPDFLRDWAADYEINDPQRLSLIDLVDSVYCFFEDSTLSAEDYSEQVCRMMERMADVIENDSIFEFILMMRATAANFWGYAMKDDRFFQLDCCGEALGRVVEWQTVTSEDVESMCFTIIPVSWQAPFHFANTVLAIGKEDKNPFALFKIYNYEDNLMDSIRIAFLDSTYNVLDILHEEELYVDSTYAENGLKTIVLPYVYLMQGLSHSFYVDVAYKTTEGWLTMRGVPRIGFEVQIEDCPRLKAALDEVLSVQAVPMDDDIKSKIGQPIKQMINRKTGEVIELDGTYYLDTVWSEKTGSYILDVKQR